MEDGTWVSVLGVLVKVVAITAAGRTINQKLPRGETEALTWTLYSAGHTHTHTHLLIGSPMALSPLSLCFCSFAILFPSRRPAFSAHLPSYTALFLLSFF